jgi:membrane protease YdiL (CAAX protease family)
LNKVIGSDPRVGRALLGLGLALLAAFSVAVVWMYFGEWGPITDSLVVLFAVFSIVALVQRWREKIRLGFGLRGGVLRELSLAFGICVLAWAGIFLVEWAVGAIRIEGVRPDVVGLISTLGVVTANAAFQEVMFRVLILCGMIALFRRPWLAVGLSSLLFALAHVNSDGLTALGLASNALGGVMYGVAFVLTGRVWMPIALHAAWNWMQGPVLGFTGSGLGEWSNQLVHQSAVGPDLITGGSYLEGSLVVIAFRFVVIALVVLATARALGSARAAGGFPRTAEHSCRA